jgi:hypothetical protein
VPAVPASAPTAASPATTPLALFALAVPAATAERAARAGFIAALIAGTWLPG